VLPIRVWLERISAVASERTVAAVWRLSMRTM
jgi:hypothetical protein